MMSQNADWIRETRNTGRILVVKYLENGHLADQEGQWERNIIEK
jgi:hypothetical protein